MELLWAKSELDKMTKTPISFCLWTKQMKLQAEVNEIFLRCGIQIEKKKVTFSGFSIYKTELVFSHACLLSSHGKFTYVSTISYQKQKGSFYSTDKGRQHIETAFSRPCFAAMDLTLLPLVLLLLRKGL